MSSRKLLMLLLALLIAGGAIVLVRQALAPPEADKVVEAVPTGPEVLVAARDLTAGSLLKDSDIKWQVWEGTPKDTMLVKDRGVDRSDYIGALSRSALRTGEPIIADRVFKANEQGFLSAALELGMRAISIKITPVTGIAGLIFPGDRVDVVIAHNVQIPGPNGGPPRERRVSETVVWNARVLALDQKTDEKATTPKIADVATLEVTPKEAEKIALISDWGGTLALVLRSLGESMDDKEAGADGIPLGEGGAATGDKQKFSYTLDSDVTRLLPYPDAPSQPPHKMRIMRGKETSEINFEQQ